MEEQVREKEPSAVTPVSMLLPKNLVIEKAMEKFEDSSSSLVKVKAKVYCLLGRERPVNHILGGGKYDDIILKRDKKISGRMLNFSTLIWVLFELFECYLLTLVCHVLILGLAILFLWSNASTFIHKSLPQFPVIIPEDITLRTTSA